MKLIIAIVQDEDSARLVRGLMDAGYGVTKLATTGGFLRSGNTTLLVGVEDERFDGAMEVIEKVCKSRKQIATSPSPMSGATGVYVPYPIEVVVGGATVFVLDVYKRQAGHPAAAKARTTPSFPATATPSLIPTPCRARSSRCRWALMEAASSPRR